MRYIYDGYSCEFYRLNGRYSAPQAAWYVGALQTKHKLRDMWAARVLYSLGELLY